MSWRISVHGILVRDRGYLLETKTMGFHWRWTIYHFIGSRPEMVLRYICEPG
jgi:hypothetical protein